MSPSSSWPTRAVILAAGFGTRLDPLTRALPKALVPLWGTPMLEHALRLVASWGVKEALVNCHAHAEGVIEFLRGRPVTGLRVQISHEPAILGTGGALRHAAWFVGDRPFWMFNADVAAALDPTPLIRHRPKGDCLATLWVHPSAGPRTVECEGRNVVSFRAPHPGGEGTFTFCGLQLIDPALMAYIPPGVSTIIAAYQAAMCDGCRIHGVTVPDSFWADIGTPDQYLDAHAEILRRRRRRNQRGGDLFDRKRVQSMRSLAGSGVTVRGFAAVAPDARVAAGAVLDRAVLGAGVTATRSARLRQVIAGAGVRLTGPAAGVVVPLDQSLDPDALAFLERAGWAAARQTTAECLAPRGSDRRFLRVRRGRRSAMFVAYDAQARPENALYAGHARFLATAGIAVPRVLAEQAKAGWLLLEDVGDEALRDRLRTATPRAVVSLYSRVFDDLERWHHHAGPLAKKRGLNLMPPFDNALYRWERSYFKNAFLSLHPRLEPSLVRAAMRELAAISRRLLDAPTVLIHRDCQSTNIHLVKGRPMWLDFQGMRFGAAAYDLASLLFDPYVDVPVATRESLAHAYAQRSPRTRQDCMFLWCATVQRLAQALGAYGRLSRNAGTAGFAKHIAPALRLAGHGLARIDPPAPHLAELITSLA